MEINMMVAVALDGAIGKDNDLLWTLKDDMRLFRKHTSGHTVVMGRKTFESLGKALPKRKNVVITRNTDWSAENVEVIHSVEDCLNRQEEKIFVIGGAEIYRQFLPHCDRLLYTKVDASFPEADTHFPDWNRTHFKQVKSAHFPKNGRNEFAFEFNVWEKEGI